MAKKQAKKSIKRKSFSYADIRGVEEFNTNDIQMLANAPIDTVTAAWAKQTRAKQVLRNVVGQSVTASKSSYLVIQLTGHPWTIIAQCVRNPPKTLDEKDAKTLAKAMKTKVIFFSESDTAGYCEYELFDAAGKSRELFRMYNEMEFRSDVRGRKAPPLGPLSLPFVDDFFRSQDAFAPACSIEFSAGHMRPGDQLELKQWDQIPADAIAQIDFVTS